MIVLPLLESHKEDLKFLQNQPTNILVDFCKLSSNFLTRGSNLKVYNTAAQKLQVDCKQIQRGVEGLAYLFVEAKKYNLNEDGFKKTLNELGFPETFFEPIYHEYLNVTTILDSALPDVGLQHYQYKDLEWRFEAQVSSRAIPNQIQPKILMKFELEKNGESKNICLQSDIPNLVHMTQLLNQALLESKTNHSKRILRAIT